MLSPTHHPRPLVGHISEHLLVAAPAGGRKKEKPRLQLTSFSWDICSLYWENLYLVSKPQISISLLFLLPLLSSSSSSSSSSSNATAGQNCWRSENYLWGHKGEWQQSFLTWGSVISYGSISKCPLHTQKFTDVIYTQKVVPQLNNYMCGFCRSPQSFWQANIHCHSER